MSGLELLPGERVLFSGKANAVVVPADHGLSSFTANELMPLVGLARREAIGGHLHVTSVRLVFKAHAFNRLGGTLSTPLTSIHGIRPWRSGLAIGVEVHTIAALQRYVTWSRTKLITAVEHATQALGPVERQLIGVARGAARDFEVNRAAETLNAVTKQFIQLTGGKPAALEYIGLLNLLGPEATDGSSR